MYFQLPADLENTHSRDQVLVILIPFWTALKSIFFVDAQLPNLLSSFSHVGQKIKSLRKNETQILQNPQKLQATQRRHCGPNTHRLTSAICETWKRCAVKWLPSYCCQTTLQEEIVRICRDNRKSYCNSVLKPSRQETKICGQIGFERAGACKTDCYLIEFSIHSLHLVNNLHTNVYDLPESTDQNQ